MFGRVEGGDARVMEAVWELGQQATAGLVCWSNYDGRNFLINRIVGMSS